MNGKTAKKIRKTVNALTIGKKDMIKENGRCGTGGLEYTQDSPRAVYKKFKRNFLKRQRSQS